MKTILIGLGMVADTHIAALAHTNMGIELTGVMGRNPDKAAAFAAKAGETLGYQVPVVTSLHDIPDVDFAIVATPPDARQDIVATLSAAGVAILMEKPVERTLDAAQTIVTTCQTAGVPLGVVLQHRARAASQHLKTLLETATFGDIATVDVRVPWWRDQPYYDAPGRGSYARDGGGVMINQAIHTLDLALWLLGPIRHVQALMRTTPLHHLEAEDWAGALFEMENGACGSLMATTAAFPGGAESIDIQGSKAGAHLASGVLTVTHLDGRVQQFGAQADTGGGADPMAFTHDWHQTVIEDFVTCLSTGATPLASGASALEAQRVIDAMERAAKTGTRTKVAAI
ncbi:Gfo/Idh/MocA family oxidoreductase [Roseobacter sp.]|uniref:Gfo/Idh/MocA family protein n=1 Tax=Roseobacter sp. TaxID=1907202 RepID=UPI00329919D6